MFVSLFNRSLGVEKNNLFPDETSLKQNAQANLKGFFWYASQLVYGNVRREKNI